VNDPFNLPPETVTNGQLFIAIRDMNARVMMIASEQKALRADFEDDMRDKQAMVEAFKTGGTVLCMIKWSAAVGAGLAATYMFAKGLVQ